MVSTAAGEGTSYESGGGAGGKFRKRPFRRPQTTPYDRPPTAAIPKPRNNGWLPNLVDPASKLIYAGARMFFSSVFRKRLPPPPPLLPEANQESRDGLQDAVPSNPPGGQGLAINDDGNPTNSFDGTGISKLEQILKQKTFTRSEIDRLTELLHSKTSDLPNGKEDKRSASNVPQPVSAFGMQHQFGSSPIQDNGIETHLENHRFHGCISTPGASSKVLDEDVASPAELAKAYMGSRPSKVSPSMLGLRSQALREDANLPDNVQFLPKSPAMSLVPKPAVSVGIPENCFTIRRSRGRSAIYNMARSRFNPTAIQKGTGSSYDGYGEPSASSSSQHAWLHDEHRGPKQLSLKRRSSLLEDDIGSVTPIRRLRQKTNLSTSKSLGLSVFGSPLSSRGTGLGSDAAQPPISSSQKPFSLDESKHRTFKTVGEHGDNGNSITNYTTVPSKSTEMATRILQQLEKSAPKKKSSEGKMVTVREKFPSKLTPNMLRGQALRSLEDVDSSKILQNAQDSHKLEDSHNISFPGARDTTTKQQDKVEENDPKKLAVSRETLAPAVISDITLSAKDSVSDVHTADSFIAPLLTQPPQKKWAFQMSAHEEFLELDDENHSSEATFAPLAVGKEKLETSIVDSNAASTEVVMVNRTPTLSEIKPSDGSVMKKSTNLGTSDASVAGDKNTGFTFPIAPASSTPFQPVVATVQSTSVFEKIIPLEESNAPSPLFSSSSTNIDKVPSLTFSSSSSVSESSGLKSSAPLESKPENSKSLANIACGATDGVPKILELDKIDNKNVSSSAAVSAPVSASSIFSFGSPANNSSASNGSLASTHSVFSPPAPVLASSDFVNQTIPNSFTNIASSTTATVTTDGTATTSTLNGGVSSSSAAPSFPAAPIFKFGSTSVAPSNSVSTVSTTSSAETTDLKAKTEKETTFGNLSSSPFGGKTFEMSSTGSSIFGFSASATSSATNLSQGSLFGTSSGSLVATQASSPSGTGVAALTQSMPIQFGSSASSPVFGISGTSSFTSSSSLFGSSTSSSSLFGSSTSTGSLFGSSTSSSSLFGSSTSPKVFDSGTSFGLSSSASSSQTNSILSSGTTSSLFGSSWQPTTFTSVSASTGLAFGASSGSFAATTSAPTMFGSYTSAPSGSIFSFTSAAATAIVPAASSQPQPIFGGSIPVFTAASGNGDQMNMEDSMAEDPVQASTPAVPVFGQPPVSAPSPGFVFGSTVPSPIQFGSQQNPSTSQFPSPFQPSGSLEFSAGGSFSLGSGGGDHSSRRILKVKHKNKRRP